MRFRRPEDEEPEINLIPLIDVLLVVLIFLMLSTSFSRFTELQVNLPVAGQDPSTARPAEIIVTVAADGRYAVDGQPVSGTEAALLAAALRGAAGQRTESFVMISADANAPHQSVLRVLDAARRAELPRIAFAAVRESGDAQAAP